MNDISSPRCFVLFERLSPVGLSLKTFAACLVSNLDEYSPKLSHHWKAKVSRSSHFVFLLQPSKPRTGETDCGLLGDDEFEDVELLPTASVTTTGGPTGLSGGSGNRRKFVRMWKQVEEAAMLPTPQNRDYRSPDLPESGNFKRKQEAGFTIDLNSRIAMLPTPATRDYKGANSPEHLAKERGHHDQLPNAIAMLECDCQSPNTEVRLISQNCPIHNEYPFDYEKVPDGASRGLKLQPGFVEWMMGYPIGHTDLKPSETA